MGVFPTAVLSFLNCGNTDKAPIQPHIPNPANREANADHVKKRSLGATSKAKPYETAPTPHGLIVK